MLPTVDVVSSVIFDGGVADDFATGCVSARWAPSVWKRPSPPVTASLPAGPMSSSSTSTLIEGVAEALVLADRLGIGHRRLEEVIEGGPLAAPSPKAPGLWRARPACACEP